MPNDYDEKHFFFKVNLKNILRARIVNSKYNILRVAGEKPIHEVHRRIQNVMEKKVFVRHCLFHGRSENTQRI